MPLSESDLSSIAKEISNAKKELDGAKDAVPNIQKQVAEKIEAVKRIKILYNNSAADKVDPLEEEHKWLNGTTYSKITDEIIDASAKRSDGNIFFPTDWKISAAKVVDLSNGNPKTSTADNELEVINKSLANSGLKALIDLLIDGQSSSMADTSLSSNYTAGSGTVQITAGSATVGRLLYISDGTNSGCFLILSKIGTSIEVQEIIPPQGNIQKINSLVKENIPGFSDSERQNLSSLKFQNVLSVLIQRISSSLVKWKTDIDGQSFSLAVNYDASASTSQAKTKISSLVSLYASWSSKPSTGATGKWNNSGFLPLRTAINARPSEISARSSDIVTVLGSVSQDSKGRYSGSGHYLQRFKCLNFLINGANGALYERYNLEILKNTFESKVSNELDKFSTFRNAVVYSSMIEDHKGSSSLRFDTVAGLSVGDKVLVCADNQNALSLTITAISNLSISFDKEIPAAYSKSASGGLIKAI
jgi:hypothetical protein